MKKQILTLLVFFIGLSVFAQEDVKIKFEETTHQFGNIKKNDPAEHMFTFTNVSDAPLKLTQVKASCGCTTPEWTQEEIAPGEKGRIAVKYNTARVGPFTKTVTVRHSQGTKPIILYIKGKVKSDPAEVDQIYAYRLGGLGFIKLAEDIGTLDSDKTHKVIFEAKNLTPHPIIFKEKIDQEMMMTTEISNKKVNPGEKTLVTVTVDGSKFITFGAFSQGISLYTNEDQAEKKLTINGQINKVFSPEELASMPNIAFQRTEYDGGVVIEGEKVDVAYRFTNTGQSDLRIESVKASCGCTASVPKDDIIKPGMSSEIFASFNSKGRQGKQSKTITVKTNDPDQPNIILRLKVEVEKNPFHVEEFGPSSSGSIRN